jgi:sigma-B regulation protein RsbU (phosphoserine phosphatase)
VPLNIGLMYKEFAMSIQKKILISILSVSMAGMLILFMFALLSLWSLSDAIRQMNSESVGRLEEETRQLLVEANNSAIFSIAGKYSEQINGNFEDLRETASSIADFINTLYKHPKQGSTFGTGVGIVEGVVPGTVAGEYSTLREIQDYIRSMPEFDLNSKLIDIYLMTESGLCIDGSENYYLAEPYDDLRKTDWYISARESGKPYWADSFIGGVTRLPKIACDVPFYDADGRFRGVVAVDLVIGKMYESIFASSPEANDSAFLLNKDGRLLASSGNSESYDLPYLLDDGLWKRLRDEKETIEMPKGDSYVYFTAVPETDWTLGMIFKFDAIIKASNDTSVKIRQYGDDLLSLISRSYGNLVLWFALLLSLSAALIVAIALRVARSITSPLSVLKEEMKHIGEGNFTRKIDVGRADDDISVLADGFNRMNERLLEYVRNLETVTAENQRIATELNVAADIQMSMLPYIFPPFPKMKQIDIYAYMKPAKEVGGDFYDFFQIEDGRIGFVIADVSDKGVPAALFMVITKTLIKNQLLSGSSPAQALTKVNEQLCSENSKNVNMFVTAFVCVLDIKTGLLEYSNAGHNKPLIRKAGGDFKYVGVVPGMVVAGFEGFEYVQETMKLEAGDAVFLYTDGVTEAKNTEDEFYGNTRLQETLKLNDAGRDARSLVEFMSKDLENFSAGAKQFDDITMLAIEFRGEAVVF